MPLIMVFRSIGSVFWLLVDWDGTLPFQSTRILRWVLLGHN